MIYSEDKVMNSNHISTIDYCANRNPSFDILTLDEIETLMNQYIEDVNFIIKVDNRTNSVNE